MPSQNFNAVDTLLVALRGRIIELEKELAESRALVEELSLALADANLKRYQAIEGGWEG